MRIAATVTVTNNYQCARRQHPAAEFSEWIQNDIAQQRVKYVKITNGLDVPFTDRHDGVPITIMPGRSENLPLDMAAHILGYHPDIEPETMFRYICKRQGWNTPAHVQQNPDTHKTIAQEYFSKLKIEPVSFKLVPANDPDPRKPVPAEQDVPDPNEGLMRDARLAAKRRMSGQQETA